MIVAVMVVFAFEVEKVHNSDNYYTSVVEVMDTYWKNWYHWVRRIGSSVVVVVVDCMRSVEAKDNHWYHEAYSFHSCMIVMEAVVVDEDIAEAYLTQAKEHDLLLKFLLILLVLIRRIRFNR